MSVTLRIHLVCKDSSNDSGSLDEHRATSWPTPGQVTRGAAVETWKRDFGLVEACVLNTVHIAERQHWSPRTFDSDMVSRPPTKDSHFAVSIGKRLQGRFDDVDDLLRDATGGNMA